MKHLVEDITMSNTLNKDHDAAGGDGVYESHDSVVKVLVVDDTLIFSDIPGCCVDYGISDRVKLYHTVCYHLLCVCHFK